MAIDSYIDSGHLVLEGTGLVVTDNGKMGIGLATPRYPVHVAGHVSISGGVVTIRFQAPRLMLTGVPLIFKH
jgi:hypothetical protein